MSDPTLSVPRQPGERRKTKRKEQTRSIETRRAILNAALNEFAERGFDGATIRRIGEKAEIDYTLITYHYKTKMTLWKAVVDHFVGSAELLSPDFEANEKGLSAAIQLKSQFQSYLQFTRRHREFHQFMLQTSLDSSDRLEWLIEKALNPLRLHVTPLIEQAQIDGDIRPGPPELIYYLLVGMTSSLSSMGPEMSKTIGFSLSDDASVEQYWQLIEQAIFVKPLQV